MYGRQLGERLRERGRVNGAEHQQRDGQKPDLLDVLTVGERPGVDALGQPGRALGDK